MLGYFLLEVCGGKLLISALDGIAFHLGRKRRRGRQGGSSISFVSRMLERRDLQGMEVIGKGSVGGRYKR